MSTYSKLIVIIGIGVSTKTRKYSSGGGGSRFPVFWQFCKTILKAEKLKEEENTVVCILLVVQFRDTKLF